MQELLSNIRELADTLARCQAFGSTELKRIGQPIEEITIPQEVFEPWREFEPVNGLTYL